MKIKLLILCLSGLLFSTVTGAVTHNITFNSSSYNPNFLNVNVGDTVTWTGSFSFHPMASTSVPAGALSFSCSTGATFSYVVSVAGAYNFQCTVHLFTGQFVATDNSGLHENTATPKFKVSPTLTRDFVNIYLLTPASSSKLTIDVMDMTGRIVMPGLLISEKVTEINLGGLSNGIYFLSARRDSGLRIVQRVVKE